ncbi:hypothetical protein UFOVP1669_2 [uncultured Caudovirales phage]|uniref:Uncharacterized protein n=1 Tax=uncultured Caudovirales phage TaxID=2100421 RepID=A0A6J5ML69_9CAUD|nr:hypothetical protein UFOVP494_2 [uncultured Caudovirales phage]CAB4191150.1 hypothetical protein UFOVP1223_11 [uncultured Caudovirales phage]CAB4222968.1 hypothetical protein UFOVP1669_2 [uncultured Caudovirales phage]
MTKQVWKIERFSTDVTDDVMSFTYSTGRQTQFDTWSPGGLILTIRNESGQANGYDLNDKVILTAEGTNFYQWFYVQEVLFNDLPGTGQGSTATVICTDLLGRLGRIQVFEESIPSAKTLLQIFNEFNSLMPTGTEIYITSDGDSTAAADASYTGTALNRLNLNMVTEQGWLSVTDYAIYLYSRSSSALLAPADVTLARTASGTLQFGYSDIKRIALGSNYLNSCVVTPPVATAQNARNDTGIAAYGIYGAEFSTVDNSATQADSFASWQVQSRADPDELSFQISVSDTANDLTELLNNIFLNRSLVAVSYKNPGDNTTYTSQQIMQGWSMSVTPSRTDMEIFTSPLTYTNFFILNDDTFGVLNTSRLGW